MSILKTLNRMGMALKYAQDGRRTAGALNGLPSATRMDAGFPVMPITRHLSSDMWNGPR
jgi:hypothetical protein